jgi:hypothetical protein
MSIAINNYLATSIGNEGNFESIKKYGIPVALLLMPPPLPLHINSVGGGNFKTENTGDGYLEDSKFEKMFNSVKMNLPSQATANWYSPTTRFNKLLVGSRNINKANKTKKIYKKPS